MIALIIVRNTETGQMAVYSEPTDHSWSESEAMEWLEEKEARYGSPGVWVYHDMAMDNWVQTKPVDPIPDTM